MLFVTARRELVGKGFTRACLFVCMCVCVSGCLTVYLCVCLCFQVDNF